MIKDFLSHNHFFIENKKQFSIDIISDYNQIIPDNLLYPYYTNKKFNECVNWEAQTIFLKKGWNINYKNFVKELHYDYDDRLDYYYSIEKKKRAEKKALFKFSKNSANYFQEYLRVLKDSPDLKLIHIMSGINRSTCYSYRIFGYEI